MAVRALLVGDLVAVDAEHPGGHRPVDVLAGGEGRGEPGVAGEVGDGPQLHLVVVGHQEAPAGRRDERLAEPATLVGADRDVVEVRAVRRQAAGAGDRLAEGGVDPPVGGDLGGEALAVGRPELLHLAVAEQDLDDRVLAAQRLEGPGVGRVPGLGLATRGQPEVVVEHGAQLLDRVDVERSAGQLVHRGLERAALVGQLGGDRPEHVTVDGDADDLHAGEHPHQRPLHVVEEPPLPHPVECRLQRRPQPGEHRGQAHQAEAGAVEVPTDASSSVRRRPAPGRRRPGRAAAVPSSTPTPRNRAARSDRRYWSTDGSSR